MAIYYPTTSRNVDQLNMFSDMIHVARMQLDYILNGNDTLDDVDKITSESMTRDKPRIYLAPDSEDVKHDKKFDELCMIIAKKCNVNAKKMSVTEFYNAIEFIKTN